MNILLDTLSKKQTNGIAIWLMRQAGRYLPEYMEVRKNIGSFLNLCYSPENASKVTIQPITRFGFDAAIIFSDILVVPHILGLDVKFLEGEGPKVQNVKSIEDLKTLSIKENSFHMEAVSMALEITKKQLPENKALIGFAGSPWTVATYILSKNKHDFEFCRKLAYQKFDFVNSLIELITKQTIIYLKKQIDSGAQVIQLFDSWSSALCEDEFIEFVIKPTKIIVDEIRKYNNSIKIIGFPKGAGYLYKKYAESLDIDGLSIDHNIPLEFVKELQKIKVIQGNLDPVVLLTDKDIIKRKVDNILNNLAGKNFIFNLGHGIIKTTPIENVEFLIKHVKNYGK
jgi:uroporphyrinogen decarboxylase